MTETGRIIDGRAVAKEINRQTASDAAAFMSRTGRRPSLVALQAGDSPSSRLYTNMQAQAAGEVGIEYELRIVPENAGEEEILAAIEKINADEAISGVILQMPLPDSIDSRKMQMAISPAKDAEGVHPANLGRLFYGAAAIAPCTPLAVVELLRRCCDDLTGREVVIVGHSEIVGKPIAMLLLQSPANSPTVQICHIATRDLPAHVAKADILITAAGASQAQWRRYTRAAAAGESPELPDLSPLIPAEIIKPGAIVIDVATNRIPVGFDESDKPILNDKNKPAMRTVGDVEFEAARKKVAAITPVPGGVGPVTVAMLLRNTVACATGWRL